MKTFKLQNYLVASLITISSLLLMGCSTNNRPPSLEERMNQSTEAEQGPLPKEDTLSYKLKNVKASVSNSQADFDFNALQLASMSSSCGNEQRKDYFQNLVDQFQQAHAQRTVYTFKYQGETQGNGVYQVFLLPNIPQYESMEAFEKDFKFCGNVARAQPALMNKDWLLFTSSCLTAGIEESSETPNGCLEIKKEVDSSFKLK